MFISLLGICAFGGEVFVLLLFQEFIIVEFSLASDVKKLLSTCSYIQGNQVVPVQSPFLWFHSTNEKIKQFQVNVETAVINEPCVKLLMEQMQGAKSVSS